MKNILLKHSIKVIAILLMVVMACKKEKSGGIAPTLDGVTTLNERDVKLSSVGYGEWVIITGANLKTTFKVDFNGTIASDSLLYADDNTITVKIPSQLTDPLNNPITVTTKYGTATLNFQIKQPAPLITSFNPTAGAPGDEIVITGDYFKGVTEVLFGTSAGTIVSNTQTEITVKVPAGVTYGDIYVTTPVGTVKATSSFGLKEVIFDEALVNWTNTSYSTSIAFNETTTVRRGTKSIVNNFTSTYGAVRFRKYPALNMTGFKTLKISVYGGPGTDGKRLRVSGPHATLKPYIYLTEGKWTDYEIPLADLGEPATIEYLTFQEFSGYKGTIYIDDVGFN